MEKYADFTQQKVCLLGTARIIRHVLESCNVIGYDLFSYTATTFLIKKAREIRNNTIKKSNNDMFCNSIN